MMELRILPYSPQMSSTGSHLLKEYANTGTPILDSLVRESIQNSLDAAEIPTKPVEMKFSVSSFDKRALFSQCSGLERMLAPKFSNIPERFICFRDYNTEGLTGEVEDKGQTEKGNYYKLVNAIGDPQTEEGAGGSCGIGKSLYFRIGVKGFVIYYSRIKRDNEEYESRLIAIMIENEKLEDSIIPPAVEGKSKSGIAYWGISKPDTTLPVTDEKEIKELLDVFKIDPYKDNETGTTVILPFIDEKRLLADNQKLYETGKGIIRPFWWDSIEDFLNISIQRWYFARLENYNYKKGSRLSVSINGVPLTFNDMAPCFKIFQALYNRAAGCKEEQLDDLLKNNDNVKTEDICLSRFRPLGNKKTGTLSYVLADKNILGMEAPKNKKSPYIYCNTDIKDNETNTPIIGYCRKPGMIVNFETDDSDWLYKVPNTDSEHFLMAVFVLNSNNRLGEKDLEEYVRKMEPNDHMVWKDSTYNGENYSFIRYTKLGVSRILCQFLSGGEQSDFQKPLSDLGKIYSWILPPEDFGKRPGPKTPPGGGGDNPPRSRSHRKMKYTIISQKLFIDKVEISYNFETVQKKDSLGMKLLVSTSDGKNISLGEWKEMGTAIPFYIESTQISITKLDGNSSSKIYPLSSKNPKYDDSQLGLHLGLDLLPNTFEPFALNLKFDAEHSFNINIKLTIHILSRRAMPTINII